MQIGYLPRTRRSCWMRIFTIFQTIDNVATGEMRLKVNDFGYSCLAARLREKHVKVLSGGEAQLSGDDQAPARTGESPHSR